MRLIHHLKRVPSFILVERATAAITRTRRSEVGEALEAARDADARREDR